MSIKNLALILSCIVLFGIGTASANDNPIVSNWDRFSQGLESSSTRAFYLDEAGVARGTSTPTVTPSDTPTATSTPTPTITPTARPMEFILLDPATFNMGSPLMEMCRDDDEILHEVTLTNAFYVQTTEVTQSLWQIFFPNPSHAIGPNRPVDQITWYDAIIFCNRLSSMDGLVPCYYSDPGLITVFDGTPPVMEGEVYWDQTVNGYRLPTESEWEYACRALDPGPYYNGDINTNCYYDLNLDPMAWYYFNTNYHSNDVAAKLANDFGLYDMYGNAWEWCWDYYGDYPAEPVNDPSGPETGYRNVTRGGSWQSSAWNCRSASRSIQWPGDRSIDGGFRMFQRWVPTPTPTSTPTPTNTPTQTPTPTNTSTPTNTATATNTPTPYPIPTTTSPGLGILMLLITALLIISFSRHKATQK